MHLLQILPLPPWSTEGFHSHCTNIALWFLLSYLICINLFFITANLFSYYRSKFILLGFMGLMFLNIYRPESIILIEAYQYPAPHSRPIRMTIRHFLSTTSFSGTCPACTPTYFACHAQHVNNKSQTLARSGHQETFLQSNESFLAIQWWVIIFSTNRKYIQHLALQSAAVNITFTVNLIRMITKGNCLWPPHSCHLEPLISEGKFWF